MNSKTLGLSILTLLLLLPLAAANSHYSYEHSEEMLHSGRIDWYEYGPKAFNDAIAQDKPVFMILTAPSWCYWCHVYMSNDYVYHPDVYPVINKETIPVRVNADKRQDLTRQYLEGGWPSTTIMAPNGKRLHGFSGPRPIQNMIANIQKAGRYVDEQGFSNKVGYDYVKERSIDKEIIMVKITSYETAREVIDYCTHIHGAGAFNEDHWLSHLYQDSQAFTLAAGSSEVMRDLLAGLLQM